MPWNLMLILSPSFYPLGAQYSCKTLSFVLQRVRLAGEGAGWCLSPPSFMPGVPHTFPFSIEAALMLSSVCVCAHIYVEEDTGQG